MNDWSTKELTLDFVYDLYAASISNPPQTIISYASQNVTYVDGQYVVPPSFKTKLEKLLAD